MGTSKSSGSLPSADPTKVTQQQTNSNVNTAIANTYLNNVDQVTPYGTLTYTQDGPWQQIDGNGTMGPRWKATQTLSPEQQKLYDSTTGLSQNAIDLANRYVGQISDATSKPYNYDSIGPAPVYNADSANKATQTLIDRNQPQMDRDLGNLTQKLANQGITVGTPAYAAAMDQYQRGVNDFRLGAEAQGQQYAANDYNASASSYGNQIQYMNNLRTEPINEAATLMGLSGGVQNPNFVNTPQTQVAPTDVVGAYNNATQAQLAQQQMQQQSTNAMLGGLFGLGSSALGGWAFGGFKSDIRTKENIYRIGSANNGIGLYLFNYIGDPRPQFGLMAQEVEKVRPNAVYEIDGIKHVDYVKALADA